MSDFDRLMKALQQTGYHQWMKGEGLPVVVGHGIEDVRDIKLLPWRRTGGLGAFVHPHGMEGVTGMVVAEIPPGAALQPERHINTYSIPLDPIYPKRAKVFFGSRAIIDACRPYDWIGEFPKVASSSAEAKQKVLKKWREIFAETKST